MRFRVKFFGSYRTTTGVTETILEAAEGTSVRQALNLVWKTWPVLNGQSSPAVVLLNRSRCQDSEEVQDDDLLEIFAPVAGG